MQLELKLTKEQYKADVLPEIKVHGFFNLVNLVNWIADFNPNTLPEDIIQTIPDKPKSKIVTISVSDDYEEYEILDSRRIDITLVRQIIEDYYKEYYGISKRDIDDTDYRKAELVEMRQIVMAIARVIYSMSFALTGSIYNKDHATALHAVRNVSNLISTDKQYKARIDEIGKLINIDKLSEKLQIK
jgi:chromosomal replication initiation ATPase DnaA